MACTVCGVPCKQPCGSVFQGDADTRACCMCAQKRRPCARCQQRVRDDAQAVEKRLEFGAVLLQWLRHECKLSEREARAAGVHLTDPTVGVSSPDELQNLGETELDQALAGLNLLTRGVIKDKVAQDPAKVAAKAAAEEEAALTAAKAKRDAEKARKAAAAFSALAREKKVRAKARAELAQWLCIKCRFNTETVEPIIVSLNHSDIDEILAQVINPKP